MAPIAAARARNSASVCGSPQRLAGQIERVGLAATRQVDFGLDRLPVRLQLRRLLALAHHAQRHRHGAGTDHVHEIAEQPHRHRRDAALAEQPQGVDQAIVVADKHAAHHLAVGPVARAAPAAIQEAGAGADRVGLVEDIRGAHG